MSEIYIAYNNPALVIPLGFCIMTTAEENQINETLIIAKYKDFSYYNKRLKNALNSGKITQLVYNTILENQSAEIQQIDVNTDVNINLNELKELVLNAQLHTINLEGTAYDIINQLNQNNFVIVKKI